MAGRTDQGGPVPGGIWAIRPQPRNAAQIRVFCFPYAGAGSAVFHGWPKLAEERLEIICVQPPGREGRLAERPFTQIDDLVRAAAAPLVACMDRPFALFGHSVGALAAFELARLLRDRHGLRPERLFVSACPAPQIPWPHPAVRRLPEADLLDEVQRRYGAVPEAVLADAEFRELAAELLRADFSLIETYRHRPGRVLDCPISAFAGMEDHTVALPELEAWRQQTSAPFSLHRVPGSHFFLQSAREILLQKILADLAGGTGYPAERPPT